LFLVASDKFTFNYPRCTEYKFSETVVNITTEKLYFKKYKEYNIHNCFR